MPRTLISDRSKEMEPKLCESLENRGYSDAQATGVNFQGDLKAKVEELGYKTLGDHGRQFDWGVLFPDTSIPPLLAECKCSELYGQKILIYPPFMKELIGDGQFLPSSISHVVILKAIEDQDKIYYYLIPTISLRSVPITLWKDVYRYRENEEWEDKARGIKIKGLDRDLHGNLVNEFVLGKDNSRCYRESLGYIPHDRLFSCGARSFDSWAKICFALKCLIEFWKEPERQVGKDSVDSDVSDVWTRVRADRNRNPTIVESWDLIPRYPEEVTKHDSDNDSR